MATNLLPSSTPSNSTSSSINTILFVLQTIIEKNVLKVVFKKCPSNKDFTYMCIVAWVMLRPFSVECFIALFSIIPYKIERNKIWIKATTLNAWFRSIIS
jgi:hypothetical protein